MSVEALPRPVDIGTTGEVWVHLFCPCDPDVSLCGADLTGEPEVSCDGPADDDCPLCVAVDEVSGGMCRRCGQ